MALLRKWNYRRHGYELYEIPDSWHCPLIAADMAEIVNCVSCGKEMTFGEGYTSRVIHSAMGFGYCVCESCMEKELAAENAARKENQ